ncbi:uncharacterized protein LOC106694172 isoform X2 [Microplitis demolitor]|uniref:uncharacterized protein LOC106694172 isoform X2 n=1 Tax=Microplitis demolitor TaxID=69319 RepID=UPI00235B69D2|nr:uncharacterized protein LOC106694172 isoform X2 [Microplitis demolitor]
MKAIDTYGIKSTSNDRIGNAEDKSKAGIIITDSSPKQKKIIVGCTKLKDTNENTLRSNENHKPTLELRKPRGKYFKSNSQIQQRNAFTTNIQNLQLLKNGNYVRNPVNIRGSYYFATNTCGFDSIIQILSSSAMDNPQYMAFIDESKNKVLKFVKFFDENELSATTNKNRIVLLEDLFSHKIKKMLNSNQIDLYDCVSTIYKQCFNDVPSGWLTHTCPNCHIYTSPIIILQVNHYIIRKNGYHVLQEVLNNEWTQKLDVRANVEASHSIPGQLVDFPINLNLGDDQYQLSGVIAMLPGHFISYCRRINNRWDKCDGLKQKIECVKSHTSIEPQGVIYTKIFSKNDHNHENSTQNYTLTKELVDLTNDEPKSLEHGVASKLPITDSLDDSDTNSRDNWRNKELNNKVYFDGSFDSIEENSFIESPIMDSIKNSRSLEYQSVLILQGGNSISGIIIDKKIFHLLDTYNFDFIVHILSCSALDIPSYMNFLKDSSNETFKFIIGFINLKSCAEIYAKRALLLKSLYISKTSTTFLNNVFIHTTDIRETIFNTWETCLTDQASLLNVYICKSCGCSSFFTPFLKVDTKLIIKNGFKVRNEAVKYYKHLKKVKCRQESCSKLCSVTVYPNYHLFINLEIIYRYHKNMKCKIQDIPKKLIFGEEVQEYRLAGIIAQKNNLPVSYCLRINGTWELYNGYLNIIMIVDSTTVIEPLGAIYTIS